MCGLCVSECFTFSKVKATNFLVSIRLLHIFRFSAQSHPQPLQTLMCPRQMKQRTELHVTWTLPHRGSLASLHSVGTFHLHHRADCRAVRVWSFFFSMEGGSVGGWEEEAQVSKEPPRPRTNEEGRTPTQSVLGLYALLVVSPG